MHPRRQTQGSFGDDADRTISHHVLSFLLCTLVHFVHKLAAAHCPLDCRLIDVGDDGKGPGVVDVSGVA